MAATSLDALPFEILLRICEYLSHVHWSSLEAAAIVNKRLYLAASEFLSRTIEFEIASANTLYQDVKKCLDFLTRTNRLIHVRCLILRGQWPETDTAFHNRLSHGWRSLKGIDRAQLGLESSGLMQRMIGWDDDPWAVPEIDPNWVPLAQLIRRLPGLTDLVYRCPSQFSPCLLDALHEKVPNCRLHNESFALRSLYLRTTDAYEMELVKSPCLYSVSIYYQESDGWDIEQPQRASYHFPALVDMIKGAAKNLKWVSVHHANMRHAPRAGREPPPAWTGFGRDSEIEAPLPDSKGSLEYLQITSWPVSPRLREIQELSSATDMSVLRSLAIATCLPKSALDHLSENFAFRSLSVLYLDLMQMPSSGARGANAQDPEFYESAIRLIQKMPNLTSLSVIGWHTSMQMRTFLQGNLSTLNLTPIQRVRVSFDDINSILGSCPRLEDLNITLPRCRGDSSEVAFYRTLGSFPMLRVLTLTLGVGVNEPSGSDEYFDEYLEDSFPYTRGHIRDLFKNLALDEALARAIFDVISSTKLANGSTPLKGLTVNSSFVLGDMEEAVAPVPSWAHAYWLARTWQLDHNPRDDRPGEIIAKELKKPRRERCRIFKTPSDVRSEYDEIYCRVWPDTGDGKHWMDNWHSFPLQL